MTGIKTRQTHVWMLLSEDGQVIYQDSTTPGDPRTLAHELEQSTGLRWSRSRISTTGSRWRREQSINRALAYGNRKGMAAAA